MLCLIAKNIDIASMEPKELNDSSPYGRGFAKSGGVATAVAEVVKELGYIDFECKAVVCNGIKECKSALNQAQAGILNGIFIEGMVCEGGCIKGNGTLVNKRNVDLHIDEYMNSSSMHQLLEK